MPENQKPSKYTILQGEAGQWQILKRSAKGGHWFIFFRNCQTQALAVLILDALVKAEIEGSPEFRIMNAPKD